MRGWFTGLSGAVLFVACGIGCGSDPPPSATNASFCASADKLLNHGTFASDGGGVVDALRGLDTSDLPGSYQEEITTAIDTIGARIDAFSKGESADGWSTEPVAALATRLCGADMSNFFAIP